MHLLLVNLPLLLNAKGVQCHGYLSLVLHDFVPDVHFVVIFVVSCVVVIVVDHPGQTRYAGHLFSYLVFTFGSDYTSYLDVNSADVCIHL